MTFGFISIKWLEVLFYLFIINYKDKIFDNLERNYFFKLNIKTGRNFMKIGYACLTEGVPNTNFKRCTLKNANRDNLLKIIEHNLDSLENIIKYNIKNNIKLFRITSDLIPFGSSPANDIPWWDVFSSKLCSIGEKIKNSGMRVSMHPGQYTVLNSPNEDVVKRAIEDLNYHNRVLDSLGVGIDNKIILHIGGVYNNKGKAMEGFIDNFQPLDNKVKQRIVIENDDKSFNIGEVLKIGKILNIPVVYDNLHNRVLPYDLSKDDKYWISLCSETWNKEDGVQKIHYSQQDVNKRKGAHSSTIEIKKFTEFIEEIDLDVDIMLEVKDKNLSTLKCINYIREDKKVSNLEMEWSKYKYTILEHSNAHYNRIRELLKNKDEYPVLEFYNLIDEALKKEETIGSTTNALLHVWGYFKSNATEVEKDKFTKYIKGYEDGRNSKKPIKDFLCKMALKYEEYYLLNSYYFYL